ncbi:hypothetical protein MNBD_ALPHA01-767 [hydrothermal vent metagenome]|uniref:Smr domain-containing protein n=1 Tax=hydrothermal vent metagenome TaxID=652676 RepID=A0A3B0SWV7_9ZZZZ
MRQKKPRGTLSDDENRLWQKVTENITRLDSNQAARPLVRKSAYVKPLPYSGDFQRDRAAPAAPLVGNSFMLKDADHNWQRKLRRGRIKPDGKIDLHGLTQDRAYDALNRYIDTAHKKGKRFILVVTGKGGVKSRSGHMSYSEYDCAEYVHERGILKTNVPRWLSQGELAKRIVSYYTANEEHGGDGALYVILKRWRF